MQRRLARRLVLQALYQWQVSAEPPQHAEDYARHSKNYERADKEYFHKLFVGITQDVACFDEQIVECTDIRPEDLHTMDTLILGILRIGVYELMREPNLSVAIVINEAVILAKNFMHREAAGYINSILDQVAACLKRKTDASPTSATKST